MNQAQQIERGSTLIVVLWTLILISFLAGEYLDHNRGKASLAINAWDSIRQREAVDSIFHLFATDSWPIPGENQKEGKWFHLAPGGMDLWVMAENESKKININTAPDNRIRSEILDLLSEENLDQAEQIADNILDWRDKDSLVRTNGAEEDEYNSMGLLYKPANNSFKLLTEMQLVLGVSRELLWGDPMTSIQQEEDEETDSVPHSLVGTFTIYSKATKRISVIVPGKGNGYTFIMAFLKKEKNRWNIQQQYRTMLITNKKDSSDQTEPGVDFS